MAYHHGDLPRAVRDEAARIVAVDGINALNLRDIARNIGVSHAAPAHHFGDKTGVLVSLAVEGYALLEQRLKAALTTPAPNIFLEAGCAYVAFAQEYPGHFIVMDQVDTLPASPELRAAQASAGWFSGDTSRDLDPIEVAALGGWSIAHGFATLWRTDALPGGLGDDAVAAFRRVAGTLVNPLG